jgi:hypothetical protein
MGDNKMSNAQDGIRVKNADKGSKGKIVAGIALMIALMLVSTLTGCTSEESGSGDDKEFEETEDQPDIVDIPEDDDDDNGDGDNGTTEDPETLTALQIPTSEITTDAKWYPYDSDGVEIRFFAVRSNDDEIHVAFDACDVCYEEKKGYRQENIQMVCNNCDQSFLIRRIGTDNEEGGCWPSYLPITIEDDYVIIKISDLEEKRYMFE